MEIRPASPLSFVTRARVSSARQNSPAEAEEAAGLEKSAQTSQGQTSQGQASQGQVSQGRVALPYVSPVVRYDNAARLGILAFRDGNTGEVTVQLPPKQVVEQYRRQSFRRAAGIVEEGGSSSEETQTNPATTENRGISNKTTAQPSAEGTSGGLPGEENPLAFAAAPTDSQAESVSLARPNSSTPSALSTAGTQAPSLSQEAGLPTGIPAGRRSASLLSITV